MLDTATGNRRGPVRMRVVRRRARPDHADARAVRDASRSSSIASGFTSAPFLPTPFHAKVVTDPREMSTPVHSAKPAQHYPSYTFPPSPPSSAESSPIDSSPLAKRASDVVASNKPALVSRASSESLGSPRAFIRDVFPDAHATILGAVDVEARDAPHWQLAMVGRTLYARMPSADAERAADLRDTVVAVLERADELGSDAVVVVLDKDDQELGASSRCNQEL